MPKPRQTLTAAQTAQRTGFTVKALRVLERHGLLAPQRTLAGWRAYGPEDLARLHQVQALRSLGLGLSEIARLVGDRQADLGRTLALQEAALTRARDEADRALAIVRLARSRLAAAGALSADDLTQLIKDTTPMTDSSDKPSPEVSALIARHYTPEQLDRLKARPFTAEDQANVAQAWSAVFADAHRLATELADPGSDAALDLARRARGLIQAFTQGDSGLAASLGAVWRETPPPQAPGSAEGRAFLAEAGRRLAAADGGV